jgi:hypothetical protein
VDHMTKRSILGSVAIVGGVFIGASAFAQSADTSPVCAQIANAKYQEWRQPRLFIDRSKTFDDGSTATDKMIVTENTAYYKSDNRAWTSAGITLRERAVGSPQKLLRDMRLAECTKVGSSDDAGQPTSIYTFDYLPGDDGTVASGKIWIADATGLPVREEFSQSAPPAANQKVAKTISANYQYNGDVRVPRGAELADQQRLNNNWAVVRNMQSGGGGLGGPQQ